jgi:hypothetical protein
VRGSGNDVLDARKRHLTRFLAAREIDLSPQGRGGRRALVRVRYTPSGRIGGRNASPVSQGKKIQVSCDTSVMKVSTIGRPIGLA